MSQDGNNRRPRRVVVSGGIGSGKSTVLRVLARLGAVVVEADRIGHEILEPGGAGFDMVIARWPAVLVEGRIDRALLAAIVFNDADELTALEAISHPLIAAEIAARVADAGDRDVAVEMPLSTDLLGPGWTRIVVDAPQQLRVRRAAMRGMSAEDVARRIEAQPSRSEWLRSADVVISNSGSIAHLEAETERIWLELTPPE